MKRPWYGNTKHVASRYAVYLKVGAPDLKQKVKINTYAPQETGRIYYNYNYELFHCVEYVCTVKPVYNDHSIGYFTDFWSSSRWPRATSMSPRRQKLLVSVN